MEPDFCRDRLHDVWFLLAHGAGAGSHSPWMLRWRQHLERLGPVEAFDYPYVVAGRRRPDPLPRLIESHHQALEQGRSRHSGQIVLVGKSMGGRVGCHLSLEQAVAAVVCLGYPLRSPTRAGHSKAALRDDVLLGMTAPVLFVQGTRDPLCPLSLLEEVRSRMSTHSDVHIVETGDHSLMATKTHLRQVQQAQLDLEFAALHAIGDFVERTCTTGP